MAVKPGDLAGDGRKERVLGRQTTIRTSKRPAPSSQTLSVPCTSSRLPAWRVRALRVRVRPFTLVLQH